MDTADVAERQAACNVTMPSEALWLLFVHEQYFGVDKKRERISEVWKFSGEPPLQSEYLSDDCLRGFANPGVAFLTQVWREYGFLLTVVQAWSYFRAQSN